MGARSFSSGRITEGREREDEGKKGRRTNRQTKRKEDTCVEWKEGQEIYK